MASSNASMRNSVSIVFDNFHATTFRLAQLIRRSITTPLASCESLFGRRQFKDFLESYAMDVGIVDRSALERHSRVDEDRRHSRGL
jgi:hypothetical protein